jgi:NDP-sugar pyrophosphorylase family protein
MILAAGLGTRLRPLTERVPKPLLPVAGVPMLERVARRLVAAGADRLVINTHHLAGSVEDFVRDRDGFGVEVRLSHEPDEPLDTGGAVLHAAAAFRRDAPFFLHNADVLTDLDLEGLYRSHIEGGSDTDDGALATLAVLDPSPERYLLFDEAGLFGLALRGGGERTAREPVGDVTRFGFAGVHVIDPRLLDRFSERGAFSIFWTYLRLAAAGERIRAFHAKDARWIDIGTPERMAEAERMAAELDQA